MLTQTTKKQVFQVIIFFIPMIIFWGIIETMLSQIPNSYTLKDHLLRNAKNAEILILGSSHSYFGINPEVWPINGINMANTSQSLWYDKEIVYNNIKQMPKLKLIILPISYFSLWYDLSTNHDEYFRQFYYFRQMKLMPSDFKALLDIRNYSLIQLYTPPVALSYIANKFQINNAEKINKYGSYRAEGTRFGDISDAIGLNRVLAHESMMIDAMYKTNVQYIKDICTIAQKNNIQVLLLTIPVFSTYSNQINNNKLDLINNFVHDLIDNKTIYYASYLTDQRFSIEDFFENDHLNEHGSNKFSKILFDEKIKYIIGYMINETK